MAMCSIFNCDRGDRKKTSNENLYIWQRRGCHGRKETTFLKRALERLCGFGDVLNDYERETPGPMGEE